MRKISRPNNDVLHERDVGPKTGEPKQEIADVVDDLDREDVFQCLVVGKTAQDQNRPRHRNDPLFGNELDDEHARIPFRVQRHDPVDAGEIHQQNKNDQTRSAPLLHHLQ